MISAVPNGYDRINIVADTYSKVTEGSRKRKTLLLKNGENKTRVIEIIWDVMSGNRIVILELLKCNEFIYAMDGICHKISSVTIAVMQKLSSNQEQANTKLLLHASHALSKDSTNTIVVRSPSGDVDIDILFVFMFEENSGKNRKILSVGSFDISRELKTALIGFRDFNDYMSSFFKKSKKHCWRLLEKNNRFVQVFQSLGTRGGLAPKLGPGQLGPAQSNQGQSNELQFNSKHFKKHCFVLILGSPIPNGRSPDWPVRPCLELTDNLATVSWLLWKKLYVICTGRRR